MSEMGRVFIAYRAEDSAAFAGRIADHLAERFGAQSVVKDVGEGTDLGGDAAERHAAGSGSWQVEQEIGACGVALIVVGRHWLDGTSADGRRWVLDASDPLRRQIETLLKLDTRPFVVLVDGATMPRREELPEELQRLASASQLNVRNDPDFRRDVERLANRLQPLLAERTNAFAELGRRVGQFANNLRRSGSRDVSGQVFISYRRSDSAAYAGRIYDHVVERFGREAVFKDVDNIPIGVNFPDYLQKTLAKCTVALVLVGPHWLNAQSAEGKRRLDDPGDFVRIEVETSHRLGMLVCPLLLDGADAPRSEDLPESLRAIGWEQALPIRNDPFFRHDVGHLGRQVGRAMRGRGALVRRFATAGAGGGALARLAQLLAQRLAASARWLAPAAAGLLLGASLLALLAVAPGSGNQVDSVYRSVHPGPTATATATATTTPTPTPTFTPTPTPSPAPMPTFTPVPRRVALTATPVVTSQSCGGSVSAQLPSYHVQLDNTVSNVGIHWTFTVPDPNNTPNWNNGSGTGWTPWADAYDASGTTLMDSGYIAAGSVRTLTIKPASWICPEVSPPFVPGENYTAWFQPTTGEPPAVVADNVNF